MSEMSLRLSLNRIDHSTEAAAEDVKEMPRSYGYRALVYARRI